MPPHVDARKFGDNVGEDVPCAPAVTPALLRCGALFANGVFVQPILSSGGGRGEGLESRRADVFLKRGVVA